jgi:NTE family protein
MIAQKKFGLALSGGGYRAAAFHLGTLRALHRIGVLDKVDVISSVSGGSILSAFYVLHHDDYETFECEMIARLQRGVLTTSIIETVLVCLVILAVCIGVSAWILLPFFICLFFFHFRILPWSSLIQKSYDKVFYKHATLSDLPESPKLVINSTDMASGRPFVFSQNYMGGSSYRDISFKAESFPLSKAVMASSCVPFAFGPIEIAPQYYVDSTQYRRNIPLLIDGGIYDNQGAQKLSEDKSRFRADYILVSDAGVGALDTKSVYNVLFTLLKTSDLMMARIKRAQIRNNIYDNLRGTRRYAYVSLGWDTGERLLRGFVDNILEGNVSEELISAHHLSNELIEVLKAEKDKDKAEIIKGQLIEELKKSIGWDELGTRIPSELVHKIAMGVGTNLTALSSEKIHALMDVADWFTEVQVKLYLPYATCVIK